MTTTDAASSYFIFFFSIFPCNFRLLMLHRSFAQLNDTRLPVYTTQPLLYRTLVNLKPFIEYNELSFRNYAIPLLVVSLPNCFECSPTVILYQYQSFLSVLFFYKKWINESYCVVCGYCCSLCRTDVVTPLNSLSRTCTTEVIHNGHRTE